MTARSAADLDAADRDAIVALGSIGALTPRRLATMLDHHPPAELFERIRGGRPLARGAVHRMRAVTPEQLSAQARELDPARLAGRCDELGVRVVVPGDAGYPEPVVNDPMRSPVLFLRGDPAVVVRRRVGVVGTRNATAAGRETAAELGEGLAREGVAVVSGLARGIDGAAHRGVRSAGGLAVAVVGSGIDVPYPRQHRDLWEWVGTTGLLVSQWGPGVEPEPWRFPLRNTIIALLSEVLVVVESRVRGGSLITANEALDREICVMVVPGSPRSPAARGVLELMANERVTPATSVTDVLIALGFERGRSLGVPSQVFGSRRPAAPSHPEHTLEAQVFAMCADRPCTLDDLVAGLTAPIAAVALAAARLEVEGWIVDTAGWFEVARSKLVAP
jgi:DNA processing protein